MGEGEQSASGPPARSACGLGGECTTGGRWVESLFVSRLRWGGGLRLLALLTVAASALLWWPGGPALAHDVLAYQSPSEGARLVDPPQAIVLSFVETPLQAGASVVVTGEDGRAWQDGAPAFDGVTVAQRLRAPLPAGSYQVTWRIVSSDGHAVTRTFSFSVEPVTASPAPAVPSVSAAPAVPSTPPPPEATASREAAAPHGPSAGVVAALVGGIVGAGAGVALVLARRRTRR